MLTPCFSWCNLLDSFHEPLPATRKENTMTLTPVSPEIISLENYMPTDIENTFVNPDNNTVVIVGDEIAYLIATS
jgi:hypothetical protein